MALSILLLGDTDRTEFLDARACMDRWGTVSEFRDTDSAAKAMAEGLVSPDVIVVAQAFPGQLSHRAIDRLRRLAPLARVVGLMGSWCEGEMRSGSPWPATPRTYWHQWPARCNRQFRRLTRGHSCSWALPSTASEEERLLVDTEVSPLLSGEGTIVSPLLPGEGPGVRAARSGQWSVVSGQCDTASDNSNPQSLIPNPLALRPHPNPLPKGEGTRRCRGLVAIRSQSIETAEWLSAACRGCELATIWQRDSVFARVGGATAGIFDGTDLCGDECGDLQRFVIALRPAPVIALLSFPRIEDQRRALSAGASVVLSKPLLVEDLLGEIEGREV